MTNDKTLRYFYLSYSTRSRHLYENNFPKKIKLVFVFSTVHFTPRKIQFNDRLNEWELILICDTLCQYWHAVLIGNLQEGTYRRWFAPFARHLKKATMVRYVRYVKVKISFRNLMPLGRGKVFDTYVCLHRKVCPLESKNDWICFVPTKSNPCRQSSPLPLPSVPTVPSLLLHKLLLFGTSDTFHQSRESIVASSASVSHCPLRIIEEAPIWFH